MSIPVNPATFPLPTSLPNTGGGWGRTVVDPSSVKLVGSILHATLRKKTYQTDQANNTAQVDLDTTAAQGDLNTSNAAQIDLNTCIANENSKLTWKQNGNFMSGTKWATGQNASLQKDPSQNKWYLRVDVQNATSQIVRGQKLDLNEGLQNQNGNFLFVPPGSFDPTTGAFGVAGGSGNPKTPSLLPPIL